MSELGPDSLPEAPSAAERAENPGAGFKEGGDATHGSRRRLAALIGVVTGVTALSIVTDKWPILLIVASLILIVMVHEFGHFVTARMSGMKVTEFFVGFGPRIWSFQKGEVEYGFKAIPAGGYVKIVGMSNLEDVAPGDESRTYRQQTFLRRFAVGIAGSVMHFVMAFILIAIVVTVYGRIENSLTVDQVLSAKDVEGPSVGKVPAETPAERAGFLPGDRIVRVNGEVAKDWVSVRELFASQVGETINIDVERNGKIEHLKVVPEPRTRYTKGPAPDPTQPGFVGLTSKSHIYHFPLTAIPGETVRQLGTGTVQTVKGIGKLFSPSGLKKYADNVTGAKIDDNYRPSSVVGITQIGSEAVRVGVPEVLALLAILNIMLGILNMLPMLPLDGGHVAIAVYERIRSRRDKRYFADVAKLLPFAYGVVGIFLVLSVSALYLDIVRPITGLYK